MHRAPRLTVVSLLTILAPLVAQDLNVYRFEPDWNEGMQRQAEISKQTSTTLSNPQNSVVAKAHEAQTVVQTAVAIGADGNPSRWTQRYDAFSVRSQPHQDAEWAEEIHELQGATLTYEMREENVAHRIASSHALSGLTDLFTARWHVAFPKPATLFVGQTWQVSEADVAHWLATHGHPTDTVTGALAWSFDRIEKRTVDGASHDIGHLTASGTVRFPPKEAGSGALSCSITIAEQYDFSAQRMLWTQGSLTLTGTDPQGGSLEIAASEEVHYTYGAFAATANTDTDASVQAEIEALLDGYLAAFAGENVDTTLGFLANTPENAVFRGACKFAYELLIANYQNWQLSLDSIALTSRETNRCAASVAITTTADKEKRFAAAYRANTTTFDMQFVRTPQGDWKILQWVETAKQFND